MTSSRTPAGVRDQHSATTTKADRDATATDPQSVPAELRRLPVWSLTAALDHLADAGRPAAGQGRSAGVYAWVDRLPDLAGRAATYAVAGLPVLPLHTIRDGRCSCRTDCGRNAAKHPMGHLCPHGKDQASSDVDQVMAWWQREPDANIGIRLPAGVIVLDVDPRHSGATGLFALTEQHGPLPETLTARTGSRGMHVWLAYSGPARGLLCPGVDIRTHNHYVVAPPSLHASGNRYEWLVGRPTAPAPQWVRRLLRPPAPAPRVPLPSGGGSGDGLVRTVATAPEGERNKILNWAAYRAYQRGGDPGLLTEIRDAALSIGLSPTEVDKTMASAGSAMTR